MKHVKNIELTDKYLPFVENIDETKEHTQKIITSFYNRFMNERNYNNLELAKDALDEYRYIPKNFIIPSGRYVRYLNTDRTFNLVLKKGGFVVDCNKYMFTLFDKRIGKFHVDRKSNIFFMKLNKDDYMRCEVEALLQEK